MGVNILCGCMQSKKRVGVGNTHGTAAAAAAAAAAALSPPLSWGAVFHGGAGVAAAWSRLKRGQAQLTSCNEAAARRGSNRQVVPVQGDLAQHLVPVHV